MKFKSNVTVAMGCLVILLFANSLLAQEKRYTINGDGVRVEVRSPSCRDAQRTQFIIWGGDFYEAWCLDRVRMSREMKSAGGVRLGGVYEKVAEKIIFWRNVENKQCTNGYMNFVDLFNAIHQFYDRRPELLYRDLDEGIREFLRAAPSCR